MSLYIVNEVTLLALVWRVLSGRATVVLSVDPLFPPFTPLLEWVVNWLKGRGLGEAIDLVPEERDTWNFHNRIFSEDVLALIEPWQRQAYGFEAADRDSRHGFAFKHLVTMFLFRRYVPTHVLAKLAQRRPDLRIHGLSTAHAGLAAAWKGPGSLGGARPMWVPSALINLVSLLVGAAATLAFVLSRIRPAVPPHAVFLLSDHDSGTQDLDLADAVQHLGEVALALRRADVLNRLDPRARALKCYLPSDGAFSVSQAWSMLGEAVADLANLYRRYGRFEPPLFAQMALLPYRRARIRGLFNRVRPKVFWSRDDYNVEHILRRQELHRFGGRQFGLNHAVQGICILLPQTRYVSMDVYYTQGAAFHPHFKDSWPADMALRVIGGFKFTEDMFQRPRRRTRGLLFMNRFVTGIPEAVRAVRLAAEAFPDRPIWVQTKKNYPSEAVQKAFVEACCHGLPNVSERTDAVYDMILDAEVVVSDPSTIVAETIQLDIPSVVLDVIPGQRSCIFRQYPDLCFTTAEACLERLRDLTEGRVRFERSAYEGLIGLEERPFTDAVLRDLESP